MYTGVCVWEEGRSVLAGGYIEKRERESEKQQWEVRTLFKIGLRELGKRA